ncbi:hypothetical protein TUM20985_53370 [Mycobacterium antarcticum]|uniref:hypothetical protein n=1 Tax=Mycolicibacterium sp. TUM20984 TaxID=3023368 RepID=UPI0023885554|nr:hypothetical protein [Mycolicibacterium sp. TUM20984]BDX34790.1 hypothetical protein TUM20985_53370 [Mycolicibacterium sp. TUM20985]GLP81606.1 hypothetical protein TUM20984_30260 [Mycolicibacterium sp. TUM20984]
MGVIVERGTARCPRCMAQTPYCFREDDGGLLRYEVSCAPCGFDYVEDCAPSLVSAPAA